MVEDMFSTMCMAISLRFQENMSLRSALSVVGPMGLSGIISSFLLYFDLDLVGICASSC